MIVPKAQQRVKRASMHCGSWVFRVWLPPKAIVTCITKREEPLSIILSASPQSGIPITNESETPKRETHNDYVKAGTGECTHFPLIQGHGYLTTQLSGGLECHCPPKYHRPVHASYPL